MHQPPTSIFFLAIVVGACLWAHIAFAIIVRFAVRHDSRAVSTLFGSDSPPGLVLFKSYQMRVKLFLPWGSACDMSGYSKSLIVLIWATRLAGTGLIVAFLLLVANFIYLASSGT